MSTYTTGTGQHLVNVHYPDECLGEHCPIHNPSDHPMREWPTNFRSGHDPLSIKPSHMERICEHGIGHPDPDDPLYEEVAVHGCDGCCAR